MILIYTPNTTARLKYVFSLIFERILGAEIDFTNDKDEFVSSEHIKINYSRQDLNRGVYFCATNLLFERRIEGHDIHFAKYGGINCPFPVHDKKSVMPFDPFAAAFYLCSRYEEYLPYKPDRYGRFTAESSQAFQQGFLEKPVINIWANYIARIITERFPGAAFKKGEYRFISTIDIDSAWSYKGKSLWRQGGGFVRDMLNGDWPALKERFSVTFGKVSDPFDSFEYQLQTQKKYGYKNIYFVLFADYGPLDKSISFRNHKFQVLIKHLADYAELGIHPGFASNKEIWRLRAETERLSRVLKREITASRQHFLKLSFPDTYRNLLSLDIHHDYTMGFAGQPGFRAGICTPYPFFDLEHNKETKLIIHPFTFMEGTLKDYLHLNKDEALQKMKELIDEVRNVNGQFISLWHNDSLSDKGQWQGWQQIFEEMVVYALPEKLKH